MTDRSWVGALVRGRTTWIVAIGVALAIWVQATIRFDSPGVTARLAFTVVPAALLVIAVTVALWRRQWLAVGALLLAVSPAVLSSVAAGERHGALAMLAASLLTLLLLHGATRAAILVAGAALAAGVAGALAAATSRDTTPGWSAILDRADVNLRGATGVVGEIGASLSVSALALWWVAVGAVAATAWFVGRRLAAGLVLIALVGSFVLFAAIERFVGAANTTAGAFLFSVAIVLTAGTVPLRGSVHRRIGRLVGAGGGMVWLVAIVDQIRLAATFPEPASWVRWRSWTIEDSVASPQVLLVAAGLSVVALFCPLLLANAPPRRAAGVNVVGYFSSMSGLGDRARELAACLEEAGVQVGRWDVESASPPAGEPGDPEPGASPIRRVTIAVVTADQTPGLFESHRPLVAEVDRVIGYWFWELERVPDRHLAAIELVDEIWAPTRFVHDAYRSVADVPVRHVPLPIQAPAAHGIGRVRDAPFRFLVSFDHLSVAERKNPSGAIAAFRRAFASGDEPVRLVVKTINADQRPEAAAAISAAAAGDERITIRDEHLRDDELAALVASSDAVVSLHRGEGLGLHIAEAMWVGTPIIATRYSGVLDLVDDACAALVDHELVAVERGDGAYDGGRWAEPDLEAASRIMRSFVEDPSLPGRLAAAAYERIASQPTRAETGRRLAALVDAWPRVHGGVARDSTLPVTRSLA